MLDGEGGAGDPGDVSGAGGDGEVDPGAGAVGGDGGSDGSGADGGEGSSSGPVDLDSLVADVDARVAAEFGVGADDGADEGEDGQGEGSRGRGRDAALPAAVKQFIDKNYKGDQNAFLEAQYESRAEARRLAEENRLLRERLEGGDQDSSRRGDPAKAFEAARQQSSEVRALDQEITTIDGRMKATQQSMLKVVNEAQAEQNEISKLEGQLTETDDQAKIYAIRAQIGSRRAKLQSLQTRFDNLEERQGDLGLLRGRVARELNRAEESLRQSMDQERSARSRGKADADRINTSFDVTFKAQAANLDIEVDSRQYKALREAVRLSVSDYLISLGGDTPPLDPMELRDVYIKATQDWAASFNIKTRKPGSSSTPRPKPRPVFRRPAPVVRGGGDGRGGAAAQVDHEKNPDYWRRRADEIGRALARGGGR